MDTHPGTLGWKGRGIIGLWGAPTGYQGFCINFQDRGGGRYQCIFFYRSESQKYNLFTQKKKNPQNLSV
jgi:hypothetical protein